MNIKNLLLLVACFFATFQSFSCTNFLVGKKASKDGSTMVSYSADSYNLFGALYHWPAKKYAKGERLKVYEWDTGKFLGEIAQAQETYNVVGNMNEYQLAIGETTFGGRPELVDTTGIIDYGSLIYITLQRAKTAREAIKVMTDLVAEYGYYSGGESFSIADPNEVWMMELIGKGAGNKGAVWVAIRIPDDCVSAHANQARIQTFPLKDKENCLYSKDVIKFAREKGYFNGKDKDFSFAKAYAPVDFGSLRYCEARVWSFFNRVNKDMGSYITYAKGETTDPMPLYIKPDRLLSLEDVQSCMRDHYEGTELDWRYDIGAGPFESPYRWSPLTWKVDGVEYCNERPVATQQTAFTFVSQSRSWLPRQVGGILWFGIDDAAQTVYYPMYGSITEVPDAFKLGNGDLLTFSWSSAFWVQNWVSNMVYGRYNDMIKHVNDAQSKLEGKFIADQPTIDAKVEELLKTSDDKAVEFLTQRASSVVEEGMAEWKKLGEYIMVKYLDGVVKKEKDGKFERNQYGEPASPNRTGYPEDYYRKVVKQTGDKYKVKF